MRWTLKGMTALCLAAGACSYAFAIEARFQGEDLVFTAEEAGWFESDPCVESLEIITRDSAPGAPSPYRTVWRLGQSDGGKPVCAPFPIGYGRVPEGLRQSIAPEALKPGVQYEIVAGGAGADGFGSFRISARDPRSIEPRD